MVTPEKIERINELARKSKSTGLTPAEKKEQDALRQEYIQAVRMSLKANLDSLKIVDEEGNVLKEYGENKLKKDVH
ncbi:DUF896 domain-containing protein [Ammoniphilus sp. CFH 90114]|uniref:DUF896 domain-containing protein n=1 Tax=Ammoniphilus sp. CFH 90114 TaxID=2493665 RepID=UPI00100E46EE|nr:DUF896 domain-containing protein [Ammoniphilus sp. CFH 90114]RXT04105.1 DUF896 domain-containing protein [Ammoniphilus sp. CFH 90114]